MNSKYKIGVIIFYVILAVFLIIGLRGLYSTNMSETVSYTTFMNQINDIAQISINESGKIVYTLTKDTRRVQETVVTTQVMNSDNFQKIIDDLVAKGVDVQFENGSGSVFWLNILGTIIPLVIIIFIWFYVMRSFSGRNNQAFTFSKSPAKKYVQSSKRVTFKDVAGVEEAVQELEDVVNFLKNPEIFSQTGARMPKGILLVGPPGTGKTLLAKASAGEANVPFFYISGSDFVELFVGVGAARVRDLFNQAKTNAPAIVFIDEIDAVGRHRGAGLGGGHDEREQTLNQILVEMDGFGEKANVIVMAATNRPDILDRALLRPGRFDKKIMVDGPDVRGRSAILKIHMRKKPIDPDVDVNLLARRTPGFVGADLENLINEAALLAARKKKKLIGMVDLQEAIDRVIAGPARKSRVVNPKEREIIAYHELGHAIVGIALPHANTVHKVTIIPHGTAALGYTESLPLEDRFLMSKDELYENITAILAGRAAEEIIFNEITTGAANDLQKASGLAKKMVTEFGMSDKLGPIFWGKEEGDVFLGKELTKMSHFSEEIASQIDAEIKKIIFETYEKCKNIIIKFKDKMHEAAKVLLEKEVLSGEELAEIVDMKEKGNYYRETEYEREVDKEVEKRDKENVKKQEEMSEKSDENKGDVV